MKAKDCLNNFFKKSFDDKQYVNVSNVIFLKVTFLCSSTDIIFLHSSKVFCHIAHNHVLITSNMRFVFPFVVPPRSLNPPLVVCYVTIKSCSPHIWVSTQRTNVCVCCAIMLFLVSHQFNHSPTYSPQISHFWAEASITLSSIFPP